MLLANKRRNDLTQVKECLKTEFDMKDLGEARKILGMEIIGNRKEGTMSIDQSSYYSRIIEKFKLKEVKIVKTTLAQHFKLSSANCLLQMISNIKDI